MEAAVESPLCNGPLAQKFPSASVTLMKKDDAQDYNYKKCENVNNACDGEVKKVEVPRQLSNSRQSYC